MLVYNFFSHQDALTETHIWYVHQAHFMCPGLLRPVPPSMCYLTSQRRYVVRIVITPILKRRELRTRRVKELGHGPWLLRRGVDVNPWGNANSGLCPKAGLFPFL